MIGYVCKYTPIEIFEAFDEKVHRIEPTASHFDSADTLMHPNICFYTKAVLEDVMLSDYDGIILTTCCDSMRRLYDLLKITFPKRFIYLLDVPRKINELTIAFYKNQMLDMIKNYEKFSNKKLNLDKLYPFLHEKPQEETSSASLNIGILGARCNADVLNTLGNTSAHVLFNLTCTGPSRFFNVSKQHLLRDYAHELLHTFPCWRMEEATSRLEYIQSYEKQLDGIIYHTVKFCENYSFEYAALKKQLDIPILKLETDYSHQCEGQIRTRIEAFIESLSDHSCRKCYQESNVLFDSNHELKLREAFHTETNQNHSIVVAKEPNMFKKFSKRVASDSSTSDNRGHSHLGTASRHSAPLAAPHYVLGIDSGSTSTNAVILDENQNLVAFSIVRTGAKSGESAKKALENVLKEAHLTQHDVSLIVSTGYGRVSIPFADKNVTEISCHGKGAHYLNPKIRTILDIGGQDSKAIRLSPDGEVTDFVMNDKCAAGTGRFLEMMARTLEINIHEMGPLSLKSKENITISSMCSVFAESEVISLIAQNKEKTDIIHGIHQGIASKSIGLLSRVGKEGDFMMTGGVAQNIGVVKAIEEKLGIKLFISKEPEIVGALGAAIFALESLTLSKASNKAPS